jgi:hypothetical protein
MFCVSCWLRINQRIILPHGSTACAELKVGHFVGVTASFKQAAKLFKFGNSGDIPGLFDMKFRI